MPYTFKYGDRPLDDFTVQRAVGSGGFGEVYYAISDGGREVALKYLRSNPDVELRGVSHCINLKSPHLVSIFDVKKDANGEYFIIMEYCSGPSLRDLLIAEPNGFGPQKAAFFVREIAKGLGYLHDRGIVHRDLKPGNLFFDDGYVKIGDYGLSKFISVSRHSAQTASVGTVHYMAPEIGSGNYSRGVDIYALGVMLYEMLLGRVPFEGSTMGEVLMKHLTTQPEVENLPAPFGGVIRKALEKDPKDRYQTVHEMMDDLLGVAEVRESLAGFSTQSLMGAAQRGTPDRAYSPIPSPNPAPQGRDFASRSPDHRRVGGSGDELSKRVGDRFDRISRKIDRKMAKLGKLNKLSKLRKHRPGQGPPPVPVGGNDQNTERISSSDRRRHMLLSLLLSAGIAAAMALLVGNASDRPEMGIATLLMIPAMTGGLGLSRYAIAWFAAERGPTWAVRALRGTCCAFPMAIGAVPILARNHHYATIGLGILIVLTVMAMLGDWECAWSDNPRGELRIGRAIPRTLITLILGMMVGNMLGARTPEDVGFTAAGIMAAVILILHANSWWISGVRGMPLPMAVDGRDVRGRAQRAWRSHKQARPAKFDESDAEEGDAERDDATTGSSSQPIDPNAPLQRSGLIRAFWALMAFCLTSGIIVQSLVLGMLSDIDSDEQDGLVIGIVSCVIVLVFLVIRKMSPIRRPGFWLETVRPLILTCFAAAVAVNTTILIRHAFGLNGDYERMGLICGTIFPALALLTFGLFTGHKKKKPVPFVTVGSGGGITVAGVGVASAGAREVVADAMGIGENILGAMGDIESSNTSQAKPDDK